MNEDTELQLISQDNYLQLNLQKTTSDEIVKTIKRFYTSGRLLEEKEKNPEYKAFFHYKCLEEIADVGIIHNIKERINNFVIASVNQMKQEKENFYKLNYIEDEGRYILSKNTAEYHIYAIKNISLKLRVYFVVVDNVFYFGSVAYKKEDSRDNIKIKQLLERILPILKKQK